MVVRQETIHVAGVTTGAKAECHAMQLRRATTELLPGDAKFGYLLGALLFATTVQSTGEPGTATAPGHSI